MPVLPKQKGNGSANYQYWNKTNSQIPVIAFCQRVEAADQDDDHTHKVRCPQSKRYCVSFSSIHANRCLPYPYYLHGNPN